MKKALVIGGSSGIGLAVVIRLLSEGYDFVYIAGKDETRSEDVPSETRQVFSERTSFTKINFNNEDYSVLDGIRDIDTLIITAGFGRVALFENLSETEIRNLIKCNELGAIQIIKKYYDFIKSSSDFYCAVMVSIAGHVASPFFSVYGAAKAGLAAFIENINTELAAGGYKNRILDVSPGSLKGTAFNGGKNDVALLADVVSELVWNMRERKCLYIPQYDEIYKDVLKRYRDDPTAFGKQSYAYKASSGRVSGKAQVTVGYLSGTFDLFHIGHLNLLQRAKEYCDYLIVGVHKDGSWKGKETFIPFDERIEIIRSIKYVDKAVMSTPEDSDAWELYHYDILFVGSDYKGTERFARYEEFLKGKNAKVMYFPYTKGTSSTQLRNAIQMIN